MKKSELRQLIREVINEVSITPGIKGNEQVDKWVDEMVRLLKNHKVTKFGSPIPVKNVKVEFQTEGAGDVTGEVTIPLKDGQEPSEVKFEIYMSIRDERRVSDQFPKWVASATISSPQKKGTYTQKATGTNSNPANLIKILSNIFNLKTKKR